MTPASWSATRTDSTSGKTSRVTLPSSVPTMSPPPRIAAIAASCATALTRLRADCTSSRESTVVRRSESQSSTRVLMSPETSWLSPGSTFATIAGRSTASETRTTMLSDTSSTTAGSSKISPTRALQPLCVRRLWCAHTTTVLSMTPRLASSQKSAARMRRADGLIPVAPRLRPDGRAIARSSARARP